MKETTPLRVILTYASLCAAVGIGGTAWVFTGQTLRLGGDLSQVIGVALGVAIVAFAAAVIWGPKWRRLPRSCFWFGFKGKAIVTGAAVVVAAALFWAFWLAAPALRGRGPNEVVGFGGLLCIGALLACLGVFGVLPIFGRPSEPCLRCPACEYNMTGLYEARCPECGKLYTLDQLFAEYDQYVEKRLRKLDAAFQRLVRRE